MSLEAPSDDFAEESNRIQKQVWKALEIPDDGGFVILEARIMALMTVTGSLLGQISEREGRALWPKMVAWIGEARETVAEQFAGRAEGTIQ